MYFWDVTIYAYHRLLLHAELVHPNIAYHQLTDMLIWWQNRRISCYDVFYLQGFQLSGAVVLNESKRFVAPEYVKTVSRHVETFYVTTKKCVEMCDFPELACHRGFKRLMFLFIEIQMVG